MKTILLLFTPILLFSGCIRETLDQCPKGDIEINVYVEKFQAVTHNYRTDMETSFNTRIKDIHYLLFKEQTLIEEGRIEDCSPYSNPSYVFQRKGLEFGNYCLALISNCSATIQGSAPTELFFVYAGVNNDEDHFTACFPFTVNCDCKSEYNIYMERTHGVIRYTFHNIPEHTNGIEMTMTNVGNKKVIEGGYLENIDVTKRISIDQLNRATKADNDISVVIGTFPTVTGMHSAYQLRLYKNGQETPWYNETVTDTLTVRRNQLLDISTRFTGDIPSFEVLINTAWDGSTSGGETDIQ